MNLDFNMIKHLIFGAEHVEKSDSATVFSKFTHEERAALDYGKDNSFATAGVKVGFETDSKTLSISAETRRANEHGRSFYSFDVC